MLQRRHFLQLTSGAIAFSSKQPSRIQNRIPGCRQSPKFWFGDYICQEWVCDDELDPDRFGKTLCDYGVVIGLIYSSGSRSLQPGWNYFISWKWVNGEAVHNSDWDDATHESELKLSNFSLPPTCH